jgi:hypothetical protein
LESKPGLRAYIGAGATALVGGKVSVSANVAIAPRVISAYQKAVNYTSDLLGRYVRPFK